VVQEFTDGFDQNHMARAGLGDQIADMKTESDTHDQQNTAAVERWLFQAVGRGGRERGRHGVGADVVQIVKLGRFDHDSGRARHVGRHLFGGEFSGRAIVQTALADIDIDDLAVIVKNRLGQFGFTGARDFRNGRIGGGEKQQVFLVQGRLGH
jgi:hypothetical protein